MLQYLVSDRQKVKLHKLRCFKANYSNAKVNQFCPASIESREILFKNTTSKTSNFSNILEENSLPHNYLNPTQKPQKRLQFDLLI